MKSYFMSNEKIKKELHKIVEEIEDETALQMLYEEAVEYKTASKEDKDELTEEQWGLIEKARNEIKEGKYHTYNDVKAHFDKWLTK